MQFINVPRDDLHAAEDVVRIDNAVFKPGLGLWIYPDYEDAGYGRTTLRFEVRLNSRRLRRDISINPVSMGEFGRPASYYYETHMFGFGTYYPYTYLFYYYTVFSYNTRLTLPSNDLGIEYYTTSGTYVMVRRPESVRTIVPTQLSTLI